MKNYLAKNVDDYIASMPEEAQLKLREMRAVIKGAVPHAEENISWGIPFYKYLGMLAGFSSFKNHISFGFMAELPLKARELLEQQGYTTKKKIIQIRFDQSIPIEIITQILHAQAKANEVKKMRK